MIKGRVQGWRRAGEFDVTVELPACVTSNAVLIGSALEDVQRARSSAERVAGARAAIAAFFVACAGKLLLDETRVYSRRSLANRIAILGETQMRPLFKFTAFLSILLLPFVALAQASLPTELPVDQALSELLKSIGGMNGASALGIALVATQAVMLFFRTPLANFAGKWKLLIAAGVSIVIAFLGLLASGIDWKAAILHSFTLGAVNTFLHQLVKQLSEKPVAPGA